MPKDAGLQPSCLPNSNKIAWSTFIHQSKYYFLNFSTFLSKAGLQLLLCKNQGVMLRQKAASLSLTGYRCPSILNFGHNHSPMGHLGQCCTAPAGLKSLYQEGRELCFYFTSYMGTSEVLRANLYLQKPPPSAVPIALHHCLLQ